MPFGGARRAREPIGASRLAGWLGLMVIGLLPFIVGCLAGAHLRGRRV